MTVTARLGSQGGQFFTLASKAGPASYLAGGFALSADDLGLSRVTAVIPIGCPTGYVPEYVASTGKVILRGDKAVAALGALSEVANTTNVSATTFTFLAIGQG